MAAKSKKVSETPLMKQYNAIKAKHPDAMLLFRVGDFYETFGEDAVKASNILGIVLTKRKNGAAASIELAGFPHHSLDTYLPKLVRAGQRVAICDQLEDPKMTKKIVKRGVTELVTPGVSYNDRVLDHKSNNFLAAIHFGKKFIGIAFLDISTGEFLLAEGSEHYIDKLIQGFQPSEILYQKRLNQKFNEAFGEQWYTYQLDDWVFTEEFGMESLTKHFNTNSLKGFGVDQLKTGIIAAGAVLHYLSNTEHNKINHISKIARIEEDKYVWLDRFTIRNLELLYSNNEDAKTLIQILDQTTSPMGARMLKRWMVLPLKNLQPIQERLNIVDYLLKNDTIKEKLQQYISQIGDLERIISKVAVGRVSPRELVQLKIALNCIAPIQKICNNSKVAELIKLADQFNPCSTAIDRIENEIEEEPAVTVTKGKVIKDGVNNELDELRAIAFSGKDYLQKVQERESERTEIPSLKIAFNNVFGYYLEVRNTHKDKVPENWIRKQTLVNAERYITEELKEYEAKIMGAEEKILGIETKILNDLILSLDDYIQPIQFNASLIAKLDCLQSFAQLAKDNNYCKPSLNETLNLSIKDGRHPVIEQQLALGEEYVPNNVVLNAESQQIIMITGPNMSGKSALLRQTALIVLMAQMGSYVPASAANIGLVDKIFTRVGASDNISSGESTFMVEMNETASILNNISERSLILLDEIGRGTSTYDGISIAWAIAEFIHENPAAKAKTLFATHYHELNEMTNSYPRIKNFNVSVKDLDKKVIFLRKLVEGGSNHSFGIHVAKMAGMPQSVLHKAEQVLSELEQSHSDHLSEKAKNISKDFEQQLSFFKLDDPVLGDIRDEILSTDINTLTPVEALLKLNEIKKLIGE